MSGQVRTGAETSPPRGWGKSAQGPGQVRPGAGASSPHAYFKQQIHKNRAVFSYFYVKKRPVCDTHLLETQSHHKFCGTYEINQANKKQRLALHRLENCEIKSGFVTFLLENNVSVFMFTSDPEHFTSDILGANLSRST